MAARFVDDHDAPPKPVEEQIYGEFYSNADKNLLGEFQQADWPRRQEIIFSLSDRRLRQLGNRLIAFNAQELLEPQEAERFRSYLREKWFPAVDESFPWLTAKAAKEQLSKMTSEGEVDPKLLSKIEEFIEGRIQSVSL